MEESILISTKQILGLPQSVTEFDLDVATHINMSFSTLYQMGVCHVDGTPFVIDGLDDKWDDLGMAPEMLSMVKTYVYLKVRFIFDPPEGRFSIQAMKEQLEELGVRISNFREEALG